MVSGVLNFTFPSREAAGCGEALAPLADLDSTFLYKQIPYGQPSIIKRHDARGQEGLAHSFTYDCAGTCTYFVTTRDIARNESCWSNLVTVSDNVGVPVPKWHAPTNTKWFDVAGRLAGQRAPPGIYFDHHGHHKIVLK